MILLILEAPLILLEFPITYFMQARPSESVMLYENKPRTVRLSSISLKEGNEPTPVFLYWILKELQPIPV